MKPKLTAPVRRGLYELATLFHENLVLRGEVLRMRNPRKREVRRCIGWILAMERWEKTRELEAAFGETNAADIDANPDVGGALGSTID